MRHFKSYLLGVHLISGFPAFARAEPPPASHPQKQEAQMIIGRNKETVRKLYEDGLNKRDWEWLGLAISEEYIGPRGEKGRAGFEQTLKPLIQGFPDIRWKVEDLLGEGDQVVVRWSWQGTHTGTFLTFPPSGKSVRNDAIAIYRFRDGKIAQAVMQSDRLGFLQQLGVVSRDIIPAGPPQQPK